MVDTNAKASEILDKVEPAEVRELCSSALAHIARHE